MFSWYLDAWSGDVYKAVKEVVEKLSEYDVESLTLNPRWARDVFKLLYEELVPRREIRQRLGIYTTPDWLAELILDNLGLTVGNMVKMRSEGKDPLDIKVLDPGVGTGTFLTLYIQRVGDKDAIELQFQSTDRGRAELAARLLRLAGVSVEVGKESNRDVWYVKAATDGLAAGRKELRDVLAEIVRRAVENGWWMRAGRSAGLRSWRGGAR